MGNEFAFAIPLPYGLLYVRDSESLDDPEIDWVRIAGGFGGEAARAEDMETFADLFTAANARPGPFLIELMLD